MDKVIKRFEGLMLSSLLMVFLDVIIGILFLKYTELSTQINVIILGSLVLVHGLFYLIRYFYDGLGCKFFAFDLIIGVAAIILGIFTIFNPFSALEIMGVMFCIWLVASGIEKIFYGYKFMKAQEDIYPLTCFIGILLILMGILALINPFEGFMLITRLVGLFLICSGIFDGMVCLLFRRRAKQILKIFK